LAWLAKVLHGELGLLRSGQLLSSRQSGIAQRRGLYRRAAWLSKPLIAKLFAGGREQAAFAC
jgi:hypothetical protein